MCADEVQHLLLDRQLEAAPVVSEVALRVPSQHPVKNHPDGVIEHRLWFAGNPQWIETTAHQGGEVSRQLLGNRSRVGEVLVGVPDYPVLRSNMERGGWDIWVVLIVVVETALFVPLNLSGCRHHHKALRSPCHLADVGARLGPREDVAIIKEVCAIPVHPQVGAERTRASW